MKKQILGLLVSVALLFSLMGCGNDSAVQDLDKEAQGRVTIDLTPRQIAILETQGLPTDYNKLDASQKSAIESIESMLCYLEDNYGEEFCYRGYVPGIGEEREHLLAVPANSTQDDTVTVYRYNNDGVIVYEDDYALLKARDLYEENVTEFVSEYVDARCFVVFSEILSAETLDVNKENVRSQVAAATCVFIDEKNCTQEKYEQLVQASEDWLRANFHEKSENIRLLLTKQEEVYLIVRSEVVDKVAEDLFSADTLCMITSSGSVSRY